MDHTWRAKDERPLYTSEWVRVAMVDVELPDGTTIEHHVVDMRSPESAVVLAYRPDEGVLMIWRHRFITGTWGWELPGGHLDAGERPAQGAARELHEETGWKAGRIEPMVSWNPVPGLVAARFHCFFTSEVEWQGPRTDQNEVADVAWVPVSQLLTMIDKGEICDGSTTNGVLYALATGRIAPS